MDLITVILMVVIVVLLALLLRHPAEVEEETDTGNVEYVGDDVREQRVTRWVAALAGSDEERAEAERCLLSLGAPVIPSLLAQLEQSEGHLEPVQQLTLERLVSNFGPQAALSMRRFLRRVHRASPAFPAMFRILRGIGPGHSELARSGDIPFSLLAPLMARLEELEGVLISTREHDDGLELMLIAALPRLNPDVASRLCRENPSICGTMVRIVERWAMPEWLDFLAEHREPTAILWPPEQAAQALLHSASPPLGSDDLAALLAMLEELPAEKLPGVCLQLATRLDDPRVQERFIRLAQSTSPVASLAFGELARNGVQGLQPLLGHLLRSPALEDTDLVHLKAATLQRPGPCVQALSLAMRSETPQVVTRASELLAVLPVEEHLQAFLKAFGRHRYSPLEPFLAAPITARWEALMPGVLEALGSEDREVQVAAMELIGFYGRPEDVAALMAQWGRQQHLDDVMLNAIELLGPRAAPSFEKAIVSAHAESVLVTRRLEILRHLIALEEDVLH